MLPLHKGAQQPSKGQNFHTGLWYDRFFNQYDNDCKVGDDGKTNWIKTVAGEVGNPAKLQAFQTRQDNLIKSQGGTTLVMSTDWHFVTGMGNNHPVENGFAWHHTLGVPYLTGAAVKGMVRAWCEVWEEGIDIQQWFGDTKQSGELIFFDAVPTQPINLKADIMTPHYGDWYAKGAEQPNTPSTIPADWHDPLPIPFLVVDKGANFLFGIAQRPSSNIRLEEVRKALENALQWLGAGAKTAAGYGRFSESMEAKSSREKEMKEKRAEEKAYQEKQEAERTAQASGLSGLAFEIQMQISQENLAADKSAFMQKGIAIVERIEVHENAKEQKSAATLLADVCESFDAGIMQNPDKTKGKKNKPVYKPNARAMAKRLLKVLQS